MGRKSYQKYTDEFKKEAVAFVKREKLGISEFARRLNIPQQTLGNWVKKTLRKGHRNRKTD